MFKITFKIKI